MIILSAQLRIVTDVLDQFSGRKSLRKRHPIETLPAAAIPTKRYEKMVRFTCEDSKMLK